MEEIKFIFFKTRHTNQISYIFSEIHSFSLVMFHFLHNDVISVICVYIFKKMIKNDKQNEKSRYSLNHLLVFIENQLHTLKGRF